MNVKPSTRKKTTKVNEETEPIKVVQKLEAYMGVDPGKTGAACLYLPQTHQLVFFDYPTSGNELDIFEAIDQWKNTYDIKACLIEKVTAMPVMGVKNKAGQQTIQRQGITSTFTFGQNFGAWKMLIACLRIPMYLLAPSQWRRGLVTKKDGKDTKDQNYNVAIRLFPEGELNGKRGGRKSGRVDAALLAFRCYQDRRIINLKK